MFHELTKLGVSSSLAHHYLKSGWLLRLGRGVFMCPNNTLSREGCLKFLSRQVTGFHVGGKTALAWRGVRHNLPAREPLSLWGGGKTRLPEWFQKGFPSRYTARNLFSSKLPKQFGLQPLPETPDGVLVSVPERALLEMLSEVGLHQGIEEARNIMEGARSLRTGPDNRPVHEVLFSRDVDMSSAFENESAGMARNPITLAELQPVRRKLKKELPAVLTLNQRQFLLGLVAGEPDWRLMKCPHLSQLPAIR